MFVWLSEINIQAAVMKPIISNITGSVITGTIGVAVYLFHQNRSRKAGLSDFIQEIECLVVEHWCNAATDADNHSRATNIQQNFKILGQKIDQENKERNRAALTEYRKAATGGDFDNPDRQPVDFDDPRISLISEKANQLRKVLGIKKHH